MRKAAPNGETPQERVARLQLEAAEDRLRQGEEASRREQEERVRAVEDERRRAEENRKAGFSACARCLHQWLKLLKPKLLPKKLDRNCRAAAGPPLYAGRGTKASARCTRTD